MSDWRTDIEREILEAGGQYMRTCRHGKLYKVLGGTIMIGRSQGGSNWRERGNTEADWKRLKRRAGLWVEKK